MGKIKANFIKNEKEIDDIVRGIEELVDKKGAKAIIEESISLDDFNNHGKKLLQDLQNEKTGENTGGGSLS